MGLPGLRVVLLACLALMVAACDDGRPSITRVMHDASFSLSIITSGGPLFPAVIHGRPFPGLDATTVASTLRMPPGLAQEFRFAPAAADDLAVWDRHRLVLVFNRSDTPDPYRDCRTQGAKETLEPKAEGYTLTLTLCGRDRAVASAHMDVPRRRADDRAGFERDLAQIMTALLTRPSR